MGAEQVAAITGALESLETAGDARQAVRPSQVCARFTHPPGRGVPWVEVRLGGGWRVGFWYPFDNAPETYLEQLGVESPSGTSVASWADARCSFSTPANAERLARFIDELFSEMYACGKNYELAVDIGPDGACSELERTGDAAG